MARALVLFMAVLVGATARAVAEPVILLHGLWGDGRTWGGYARHLAERGWEEGCALQFPAGSTTPSWVPVGVRSAPCGAPTPGERKFFRVIFLDNDGQSFEVQGRQVAAAVAKVRGATGAARVTLVGHSMGGLAARAYLQSPGYAGDVSAFASVATPHLGSLLPYLASEPDLEGCTALSEWLARWKLSAPAVAMLAPDSLGMVALNRPDSPLRRLPETVRYASVIAHYEAPVTPGCLFRYKGFLARYQDALSRHFDAAKALSLATSATMAHWTDGVVPAVSQHLRSVPAGYHLSVETRGVESFHSDVTAAPDAWLFLDGFIEATPAASADAVDLIFCIDTTGSMRDDIDAVKASAGTIIDRIKSVSASVRLALVAYRDYGDEYVSRGYAFTQDAEAIRRNILGLTIGGGGDDPEAVYDALLDAILTKEIGPWRVGAKKIVVLMGDAPPHSRKHTLAEVVKAAEEVDPAHIFPITVAGSSPETVRAFSELAKRTGGVMGTTRTAAELPGEIVKMVSMGARLADEVVVEGVVTGVMGDTLEIGLAADGHVRPGSQVIVLSRETPGLVIGEGPVVTSEGRRLTVELRAMYGTEGVGTGCPARVMRE